MVGGKKNIISLCIPPTQHKEYGRRSPHQHRGSPEANPSLSRASTSLSLFLTEEMFLTEGMVDSVCRLEGLRPSRKATSLEAQVSSLSNVIKLSPALSLFTGK